MVIPVNTIARTATTIAAAAGLAGAGLAAGAAVATAAPGAAPTLMSFGNTVWVYGLGGCQGSVKTQILTDPAKKGQATIVVTPQGASSPGCQADLTTSWMVPRQPFTGQQTNRVAVTGSKPTQFTINPGSGYAVIGFATGGQTPVQSYISVP